VTGLTRKVRREVARASGRPLVVILHPAEGDRPAVVEVKEKGRRAGFSAPVGAVFQMLAERAANMRRSSRRGARATSLLTGRAR
jgi:hypothetical protein